MTRLIIETVKALLAKANFPVGVGVATNALQGQFAADAIKQELLAEKPSFVARFGWTELDAIIAYTCGIEDDVRFGIIVKFILRNFIDNPNLLKTASGFFSNDLNNVKRFCKHQMDMMGEIDIYGSWMKQEQFVEKFLNRAIKVSVRSLFDPFAERPWTEALEGKRVLIVHPFASSFKHQYERRELLFQNKKYLPDFHLETYRPVQIVSKEDRRFKTWWDALRVMKADIEAIEFDVALLGCGAFGHPLCSHIKNIGRKAVYMGGDLQMMFGIYGSRWEGHPLLNSNWIRPLEQDLPHGNTDGAYQALKNYI